MDYYMKALNNYATFTGRATRSEYWYFVLFNIIIGFVFGFVCGLIGLPSLSYLFSLAMIIPSIAVAIRRMHDVNKSGWFCLIPFYNLYLACIEGTNGDNEYGADPNATIESAQGTV